MRGKLDLFEVFINHITRRGKYEWNLPAYHVRETFFEGKATSMKTGCLPRLSNVAAAVSVGLLIIMRTMKEMVMIGLDLPLFLG